jgi:hypothetical protein
VNTIRPARSYPSKRTVCAKPFWAFLEFLSSLENTLKVTTRTGSVYMVDPHTKTWPRVSSTEASGPIRTDGGEYIEMGKLSVGLPMNLIMQPLDPAMSGRLLSTSVVISIEETTLQ